MYGRSFKGVKIYDDTSGKKTHSRLSVIAAYVQRKIVAPFRLLTKIKWRCIARKQ